MQNSKKKILEIIKSMGAVGAFLELLWKIVPVAGGVIMTLVGLMNEYPLLWMVGVAIFSVSIYRWWTGRRNKPTEPQVGDRLQPAAQGQTLKTDELTETHEKPIGPQEGEPEKPEIQEQPSKPDELPDEPRRERMAWEIKAERAQQFRVYEAACVLTGKAPRWPLEKETPEENEYELLRLALLDDELGGELTHEAGFAEGDGGDESRLHLVELERRNLRAYLQAKGREIPEFLDERFDKRPRQYMPFKHQ